MNNILNQIKEEMSYSNLEQAEEMLEMAEVYDALDAEDFEQMDDAEYAEYLEFMDNLEMAEKKKHGKKPMMHRLRHKKGIHPKKKVHGSAKTLRGRAKLAAVGGGGAYAAKNSVSKSAPAFGSKAYINDLMTRSKGDLNITIQRIGRNITSPLPYILFDLNGFNSSYISTIKGYLPAGVTMVASVDPANGDVLLTYTAPGPLVDVIRISLSGSQISYSEFLQSMNSNFFKTNYIRQEYPNVPQTLLLAVSQSIAFGLLSALGMKNANNLLPRSRRLNDDYQTFILNLFLPEQKITSDFSFVQNIIDVDGYVIAWDIFMSERTNLNNI